jgi:oligopeptide/dipeptide ABC transporter ATP-binding protein
VKSPVFTLFSDPRHPYTLGLLAAMRSLEREAGPLAAISGTALVPVNRPGGCSFAPRCGSRLPQCQVVDPEL